MVKKWNGSQWSESNPRKWNGSSWVEAQGYKWDGSKWSSVTAQQYTTQWIATWSQSYTDNNSRKSGNEGNLLYQGRYSANAGGTHKSLCGFNMSDMRSQLSGAKIDNVEIYLKNSHWYYNSGGTAIIGYHNHNSNPTKFSDSEYGMKKQAFNSREQALWIPMSKSFGEGLRDGNYKGFSLFANTTAIAYYGYFYGANSNQSYKPRIKITYTK